MLDQANLIVDPALEEIVHGLKQKQKTLPARLFYDAEGCRLFGKITHLPEYYVTRTELELLQKITPEIGQQDYDALIEYGGSDETKALPLLDQIRAYAYVPIDVAGAALDEVKERLSQSRPKLQVVTIQADFLQPFSLPSQIAGMSKLGFFPGSTIGNLNPGQAADFLRQVRRTLGNKAAFLIGVDLKKAPEILIPAYDDIQGVTAAFNRNILAHLNRVADGNFDPLSFDHRAVWNSIESRIEMHLVSARQQTVFLAGHAITFNSGETIHTENSYKHTVDGFIALASTSGWTSRSVWTDDAGLFSIHLLAASGADS